MKHGKEKEISILTINEKGQLSVLDPREKEDSEYIFNKIGDCSNGIGICLGFDPDYKDDKLGW